MADNRQTVLTVLMLVTSSLSITFANVKKAALTGHNDIRRREVNQENVADMNRLVWSNDLARRARAYGDRCIWGHQDTREKGENLYFSFPKNRPDDVYVSRALESWVDEKKLNRDKSFNCCNRNNLSCCHYTQVVSSKSRRVGCAVSTCGKLRGTSNKVLADNAAYVVCFYTPPGNVVVNGNPTPYKYGKPCSECPRGQNKCQNKLCV